MRILTLVGLLMLAGCAEQWNSTEREYSEDLFEDAVVEDCIFQPSQHGSGVSPTYNFSSGSVGVAFTSVDIPEKYAIVFHCQHGKFVIEGTDERYKSLWKKLVKGGTASVCYREAYLTTYRIFRDKTKPKELVSRVLRKYDFIDAEMKK